MHIHLVDISTAFLNASLSHDIYITLPKGFKLTEDQKNSILNQIPANRMGEASDIAEGVIYLASSGANYLTGTTLHINGGMAMI
jgi:3-oxoacyl-[acyl-carrier protein] reductase